MEWPHGHFHCEACKECEPQPRLCSAGEVILHQRRNVRSAGLAHHPEHRNQHQNRADQRVKEELIARIDPVITAPYANDQIHRDKASFKEDVEKEQVLRGKRADHQHFHEQEGRHVFAHTLLDGVPAC